MNIIVIFAIGGAVGAVIGGVVGYFGKRRSGFWPFTNKPYLGAIYGAIIGVVLISAYVK